MACEIPCLMIQQGPPLQGILGKRNYDENGMKREDVSEKQRVR